jgi:hypothetical protein
MKPSSDSFARILPLTALLLIGGIASGWAFNQDHYFLYKTVSGVHNGVYGSPGIGLDDKIYVPDYSNSRVGIYDPDLTLLSWITVPSLTFRPHDVAVGPDGTVYVADPVNDKVFQFDPTGAPLTPPELFSGGLDVHYVRIHPVTGNIYAKDSGGGYKVYQPDGTLVKSFSLPAGSPFTVLPDGRLHLVNGTIYNDLGILEKSGLPGGQWIQYSGGMIYTGQEYYGGYLVVYDADYRELFRPWGAWQRTPNYFYRFNVNRKGDVVCSDAATVWLFRRCEGNSMGPEIRNAAPVPEVTKVQQRPNTTILEVEYKVTDMDDATVHTAVAAFANNTNDLNNLIPMNALVEGTDANVGPGKASGTVHSVNWDVGADWGVDFGDVSVHVFARDARPHLMGLHFLDLPAEGTVPAMTITRSPVNASWFMEPLMWLAASKNPSVAFSKNGTTGEIHAVGGTFDGELLASGTSVTQKGREFIEALMGVREATAQEIQWAREAATPGIVNQWDLSDASTQKIDRDRPRKVNEYGFDTGDYDATWFWLIKP